MIYSPSTCKACNIMYDAHKDDIDKGGYPYVFHPFYVATQMDDEDSCCVALLHDVIEDHGDRYSIDDIRVAGFNDKVVEALILLTHDEAVPYMDYIRSIGTNSIATRVKMADLRHNMDSSRVGGKRARKYDTYVEAYEYLSNIVKNG